MNSLHDTTRSWLCQAEFSCELPFSTVHSIPVALGINAVVHLVGNVLCQSEQ